MTATEDRWRPGERLTIAALAILLTIVAVIGIRRPLFIDEGFSVLTAGAGYSEIIERLRADNNLPLYFVLLHWWIAFAGSSEVAVRIPSIGFYIAAVGVAFVLGRELGGGRRFGLYSAVFFAASLQAVHLAQKVRGYTLMGLLAALSLLLFIRAFGASGRSNGSLLAFVAANVAGTFTHVWFVFLLVAEGLCGVAFWPAQSVSLIAALAASVAPFLVLWGSALRAQLANGASDWITPVTLWSPVGALLEFFGGWPIGAIVIVCAVAAFFATDRHGANVDSRSARLVASVFSLTVAVPLIVSIWKPVYWPGRYTIIALPALAVCLSLLLTPRVRRDALAAFAILLMTITAWQHITTRDRVIENSEAMLAYVDSDKNAADQLIPRLAAGDTVIFTGLSRASLEYYLHRSGRADSLNLVSYPAANAMHLGWDDARVPQTVLDAEAALVLERLRNARAPQRVWVIAGRNDTANRTLAVRLNAQFGPPDVFNWRGAFFSGVVAYPQATRSSP